jgi:cupin 2 domain-containing protein
MAAVEIANLFAGLDPGGAEETFTALAAGNSFRLERIVSSGQATPSGEWFDQDRPEWVLLLRGSAGLLFAGEAAARTLEPGDCLEIPPHVRHRVEWTDPDGPTVWLALHFEP